MNTNRLINMAMNMLMRHGMKWLMKGQKADPNAKRAQQAMKIARRTGRM